jgi:hypothetical protein
VAAKWAGFALSPWCLAVISPRRGGDNASGNSPLQANLAGLESFSGLFGSSDRPAHFRFASQGGFVIRSPFAKMLRIVPR